MKTYGEKFPNGDEEWIKGYLTGVAFASIVWIIVIVCALS